MIDSIPKISADTINTIAFTATRDLDKMGQNVVLEFLVELREEQPELFELITESLKGYMNDLKLSIRLVKLIMLILKSVNAQIEINSLEEDS